MNILETDIVKKQEDELKDFVRDKVRISENEMGIKLTDDDRNEIIEYFQRKIIKKFHRNLKKAFSVDGNLK